SACARWSLAFRSRSPRHGHIDASVVPRHPGGRHPLLEPGLEVHHHGDRSCEAAADHWQGPKGRGDAGQPDYPPPCKRTENRNAFSRFETAQPEFGDKTLPGPATVVLRMWMIEPRPMR